MISIDNKSFYAFFFSIFFTITKYKYKFNNRSRKKNGNFFLILNFYEQIIEQEKIRKFPLLKKRKIK